MRSALVIGANSTIGNALEDRLRSENIEFYGSCKGGIYPHIELDLADPRSWPQLPKTDVTYLCAAITKLETCENDPTGTRRINIDGLQQLATQLLALGSFVVFLSSNQVFDGEKPFRAADDKPCPINEYGRQKAEFEAWLLAHTNSAVLRMTKVISAPMPILKSWELQLKQEEKIEAFDDLVFSPISLKQALDTLIRIGHEKQHRIYQLSGAEDVSYFDVAQMLAESLGVSKRLVKKSSAQDKGIAENFLPRYGSLAISEGFIAEKPEDILLQIRT